MIKVVAERRCKPGSEEELKKLLEELRKKAMQRDGNYSFEVWRSLDEASLWLVLASWTVTDEWKAWRGSPERQEIIARIESLLSEPAKESVFELAR